MKKKKKKKGDRAAPSQPPRGEELTIRMVSLPFGGAGGGWKGLLLGII